MSSRKIKDAKDLSTNELIYFKGHAKATYMSNGTTVEDAINNVGTNIDLTNYATKTEIPTKVSQLENDANYVQDDVISDGVYAVDASGKLIDYNTADSSCLGVALVAGEHKFMIAKSDATDGTNTTLYWGKNLYQKDVAGITNISSGADYIGEGKKYGTDFTTWSTGPVVDFNGAANTAAIIAGYAEHGVSMDARDMCTVLNTFNTSDSYNDWYVPACGQLALMYLAKTDINAALAKIGGTAFKSGNYWSSSGLDAGNAWYVYFYDGSVINNDKRLSNRVRFVRDISVSKSLKERVSDLELSKQDALISGTNIKTINGESILGSGDITISGGGSNVTELTVADWGFTKNTGTYSKPSTGIPKSDFASDVQTSLGKADTALQSVPSEYVTETELSNKGYATSSQLNSGFGNMERKLQQINGELSYKQPTLVSGTNIKTINGNSILGSGNLVIEGGGGSSSGGSGAYAEINHGTSDTTFTLTPNTFHIWDEVASLDLSFADETAGVANEYLFQFTSGATATMLTLPDSIKWANDTPPTIAENMIYQISILKGLASVLEFKVNLQLIENLITVTFDGRHIKASSQYPVMSDIAITTNCGSITIANGDSNGTGYIDMAEPTLSVLQIIPHSDNTYVYTY